MDEKDDRLSTVLGIDYRPLVAFRYAETKRSYLSKYPRYLDPFPLLLEVQPQLLRTRNVKLCIVIIIACLCVLL